VWPINSLSACSILYKTRLGFAHFLFVLIGKVSRPATNISEVPTCIQGVASLPALLASLFVVVGPSVLAHRPILRHLEVLVAYSFEALYLEEQQPQHIYGWVYRVWADVEPAKNLQVFGSIRVVCHARKEILGELSVTV
jgi:hypothetical protein